MEKENQGDSRLIHIHLESGHCVGVHLWTLILFMCVILSHMHVLVLWCSVVHKIVHYLGEVLEDERDKLKESLTVNGSK